MYSVVLSFIWPEIYILILLKNNVCVHCHYFSKTYYSAGRSVNSGPACLWAKPLHTANVTAIGYGNTQFGEQIIRKYFEIMFGTLFEKNSLRKVYKTSLRMN